MEFRIYLSLKLICSHDNLPWHHPQAKTQIHLQFHPQNLWTSQRNSLFIQDHQNDSIVKWSPNGIGFVVVNESGFAKTILPKYFKHSNYSSFVRQVPLPIYLSSTCITFIKSVNTMVKVTFIINTLTGTTGTFVLSFPGAHSLPFVENQKRKRENFSMMRTTSKSLRLKTAIMTRRITSLPPLITMHPFQINPPQNLSLSKTKFPTFNQNLWLLIRKEKSPLPNNSFHPNSQ